MFNWFKKKEKVPAPRGRDIIWITNAEKWNALLPFVSAHQPAVVMGWFQETLEQAKKVFETAGLTVTVQNAHNLVESSLTNKTLVLLEHYPLPEKEAAVLSMVTPREILVLSALEEPLFTWFGGERLKGLMEKLGMTPGETLEHSMISASIKRAQEKLSSRITVDFSARSQLEWFRRSGFEKTD